MTDPENQTTVGPRALLDDVLRVAGSDGDPHLMVSRCGSCGGLAFPPRERCAGCSSCDLEPEEAPADGTLYSWTVVRELGKMREGFTAYALGQVDLSNGVRVMGVIAGDLDSISIGMPLRTILLPQGQDEDGTDLVGYGFAPAGEER